MASNPYGPQEIAGPFIQELNKPPQALQQAQAQPFSGYEGKLGVATGLISKFLAGAAEGRMRKAQAIENQNAQQFASISRIAQLVDDPSNPLQLTPEARAQKSSAIMKTLAGMVQSQDTDRGKGGAKDKHPALGFIKNVAERITGGPLPKKWSPDQEALSVLHVTPDQTIGYQGKQIESKIGQDVAAWQKANPGTPITTAVLQSTGIMDQISQASRMGVQSPGLAQLMKTAQDNDARLGREEEKRKELEARKEFATGKNQQIKTNPGSFPQGTEDIETHQVIPQDHAAFRVFDADNRFLGYRDAGVPGTPQKPVYKTLKGPDGNPEITKIYPDGRQEPVGPAPVSMVWKTDPDTGELKAVPKYAPPSKAPAPPANSGASAGPSAGGPKTPSSNAPPKAGEPQASAVVKSYAQRVKDGQLTIDKVPAKQRGRVQVYLDQTGYESPITLTIQGQKAMTQLTPIENQLDRAISAFETLKEDNTPGWVPGSKLFDDWTQYKLGRKTPLTGVINDISMSGILGASRLLSGSGGVRAKQIFQEAQQHTPRLGVDSPAQIYDKLLKMKKSVDDAKAAVYQYDTKSGVPRSQKSNDRTPSGGPPPPPRSGTTVKMRAPNGQTQDVPASDVDHYKSLGATVVQ